MAGLRMEALAAGLSASGVMLLTALHHAYGAMVYRTPWRLHIVPVSIVSVAVIAGALVASVQNPRSTIGKAARWLAVIVIAVVPVLLIGLFEGTYNHLLKNVLFFAGTPLSVMRQLFPPPTYELPNNLLFEVSGVLQVPVAGLAAVYDLRLARGMSHRAAVER